MITVLAGGVGAARFLAGLLTVVEPSDVTAIVNTADDVELHGLWISPDLDTVTYTLGGVFNTELGWGLRDETWRTMAALARYEAVAPGGSSAGGTWFGLGDADLATHLYRTGRRREGATLTAITAEIATAWGLAARLLPMSDDRVETRVTVREQANAGRSGVDLVEIGFQDYFVARRHAVPVASLRFAGITGSRPAPGVLEAIADAEIVVVGPSNPLVSIGPIRAVPGVEAAIARRRDDVVAISPIVAGAALKGPADHMLVELGHDSSVVGVARLYAPIAGTLVIDGRDAALAGAVEAEGVRCVVAQTVMRGAAEAATLADTVIGAARR